jgi:putative transposase
LIDRLVGRARAEGLVLAAEGGLLAQLTKRLVESALEGELTDHLGYGKHDAACRDSGNSRNGRRSKTVLTEVGPAEIDVPRDRDGSFVPKIIAERQRRLSWVDELVLSLSAKGLTTGEVQAHLAEAYGAQVSRQTISTITDKVVEGMAEWQNSPKIRTRSVSSVLTGSTNRLAKQFARGQRGGIFTMSIPASAMTASNAAVNPPAR